MRIKPIHAPFLAIPLALALTGCGDKDATSDKPDGGGTPAASAIPQTLIADAAPEGALSVVEARKQTQPGTAITLRGKVGGKKNPISDTAAILVLADEQAIQSCDDIPGDDCKTPWDYCCEVPSTIAASTATIQVRGADAKLVRTTLRGVGGLKELSRIIVSGTVDPASTAEALIVNAEKIHVEKP